MSLTVIAFAVMALVAVAFGLATMIRELNLNFRLPALTQTGDSSLSPQSVNWLAAIAIVIATVICFVFI